MQLDPESNRMAGTKPHTREAFDAVWERVLADGLVVPRVIVDSSGEIVGQINRFKADGLDAVGYWIAREHWGKGIGSRALELFLAEVTTRPLHATAARNNARSLRVLTKAGFRIVEHVMGEETHRYVAREVTRLILE